MSQWSPVHTLPLSKSTFSYNPGTSNTFSLQYCELLLRGLQYAFLASRRKFTPLLLKLFSSYIFSSFLGRSSCTTFLGRPFTYCTNCQETRLCFPQHLPSCLTSTSSLTRFCYHDNFSKPHHSYLSILSYFCLVSKSKFPCLFSGSKLASFFFSSFMVVGLNLFFYLCVISSYIIVIVILQGGFTLHLSSRKASCFLLCLLVSNPEAVRLKFWNLMRLIFLPEGICSGAPDSLPSVSK